MEYLSDPISATGAFVAIGIIFIAGNYLRLSNDSKKLVIATPQRSKFSLNKSLSANDETIVDMLLLEDDRTVSWILTDPDQADNPIVYSSGAFCSFWGYEIGEILGKNCRFLQGKETNTEDVDRIRKAIRDQSEVNVCLLNYKKDGTPVVNQFHLRALFTENNQLAYFLGVQAPVSSFGKGQQCSNAG